MCNNVLCEVLGGFFLSPFSFLNNDLIFILDHGPLSTYSTGKVLCFGLTFEICHCTQINKRESLFAAPIGILRHVLELVSCSGEKETDKLTGVTQGKTVVMETYNLLY